MPEQPLWERRSARRPERSRLGPAAPRSAPWCVRTRRGRSRRTHGSSAPTDRAAAPTNPSGDRWRRSPLTARASSGSPTPPGTSPAGGSRCPSRVASPATCSPAPWSAGPRARARRGARRRRDRRSRTASPMHVSERRWPGDRDPPPSRRDRLRTPTSTSRGSTTWGCRPTRRSCASRRRRRATTSTGGCSCSTLGPARRSGALADGLGLGVSAFGWSPVPGDPADAASRTSATTRRAPGVWNPTTGERSDLEIDLPGDAIPSTGGRMRDRSCSSTSSAGGTASTGTSSERGTLTEIAHPAGRSTVRACARRPGLAAGVERRARRPVLLDDAGAEILALAPGGVREGRPYREWLVPQPRRATRCRDGS